MNDKQILIEALLELRELVKSGSAEMAIIDEALKAVGLEPWKLPVCA